MTIYCEHCHKRNSEGVWNGRYICRRCWHRCLDALAAKLRKANK